MQKTLAFLLILFPCLLFGQSYNKIEVAVLGTFHFGETPDFKDSGFDDVLTRKRQKEIRQVVKKLAAFEPNKIFVENTAEAQEFWDDVYQSYQNGIEPKEQSILKNEIFQLGIRTAAQSPKANGIICINYVNESENKDLRFQNSIDQKWSKFSNEVSAKKPSYDNFFKSNALASNTFETFMAKHQNWKKLSLKNHLIQMNDKEVLQQLQYVNVLAWMDNNVNGIGAELASQDYFRNLKIVQNLYSKLERSDDKILIIFGAAHTQIITNILESHPVFEVKDIKSILE